jgi:hypothetical protein
MVLASENLTQSVFPDLGGEADPDSLSAATYRYHYNGLTELLIDRGVTVGIHLSSLQTCTLFDFAFILSTMLCAATVLR